MNWFLTLGREKLFMKTLCATRYFSNLLLILLWSKLWLTTKRNLKSNQGVNIVYQLNCDKL